jgi:hypothetical protein
MPTTDSITTQPTILPIYPSFFDPNFRGYLVYQTEKPLTVTYNYKNFMYENFRCYMTICNKIYNRNDYLKLNIYICAMYYPITSLRLSLNFKNNDNTNFTHYDKNKISFENSNLYSFNPTIIIDENDTLQLVLMSAGQNLNKGIIHYGELILKLENTTTEMNNTINELQITGKLSAAGGGSVSVCERHPCSNTNPNYGQFFNGTDDIKFVYYYE